MVTITLYYDIGSPYSCLAFETINNYISKGVWKDVKFELQPILVGGIFKLANHSPPSQNKLNYIISDVIHCGQAVDLQMKFPSEFPRSTLLAMRVLTCIKQSYPDKCFQASRNFFRANFIDTEDTREESVLKKYLLLDNLFTDQEIQKFFEESKAAELKAKLEENTDKAFKKGVFGVPTFFVPTTSIKCPTKTGDEEMFFGNDRIDLLAERLGLPWCGHRASCPKSNSAETTCEKTCGKDSCERACEGGKKMKCNL